MDVRAEDIRSIPLFRDIPSKHLDDLLKVFQKERAPSGQTLFKAGEVSTKLILLITGEVTLYEEEQPKFRLHPVSVIGELGGLTGTQRYATAVVSKAAEIWTVESKKLMSFFDAHADIGFPFYRSLLSVVSEKVGRDKERMDQMRKNLIRTQKAMKELRDFVLASPETVVSSRVVDTLEEHIGRNRRAGYRVSPSPAFPAFTKLDDGTQVRVLNISNGYLKVEAKAKHLTKDRGGFWLGVLVLPTKEVAVSGTVEREAPDGVVIKLDTLADDAKSILEDYVTRVQLLDFVV
ncbi:MAG: cyclic nucleotide-binding domain-containing protein [Polyangiaceae bacterium]